MSLVKCVTAVLAVSFLLLAGTATAASRDPRVCGTAGAMTAQACGNGWAQRHLAQFMHQRTPVAPVNVSCVGSHAWLVWRCTFVVQDRATRYNGVAVVSLGQKPKWLWRVSLKSYAAAP